MWPRRMPLAEYGALARSFKPDAFDARAIVASAKAAGMKYVVFTAKHHDGFAMCISRWMRWNGESVHGTSASDLAQPAWGRITQRGDTLYAHVFEWPEQPLVLPVDQRFLAKIELVGDQARALEYTPAHGSAVLVKLPTQPPNPYDSVLRISLR